MAEQGHKANIIIKRVKKVEGGSHGGSWKVAYADFVTAMMAFFLLMWLLNMVPQEKKQELASYFNDFSIFQNAGPSAQPMESGGLGPPGAIVGSQAERPDVAMDQGGQSPSGGTTPDATAEAAAAALKQQIEDQLAAMVPDLANQVSVTQDHDKVRIEIMDKSDSPLFDLGSAKLLPAAQKILAAVTSVVRQEGVKLAIEGHTDAYKYSGLYTNWDLSTERALTARRLMVQYGLDPGKVAQVTGYADTRPYVAGKPYDPKNRRISLLLFRPPKSGEKPGTSGPGTPGAAEPEAPAAPKPTPSVGEALEQQIDNLYDRSTDRQF